MTDGDDWDADEHVCVTKVGETCRHCGITIVKFVPAPPEPADEMVW